MKVAITIFLMAAIGAIIGGVTNHLAIKMLFRPYTAKYIGKWRVPFTPGLIPKRRDELAEQMGKMVVEHLITPESIRTKFLQEDFQKDVTGLVKREMQSFLESDRTLGDLLHKAGVSDVLPRIERSIDGFVEKTYENTIDKYRSMPISDIVPQDFLEGADRKIPEITSYIMDKGVEFFSSTDGRLRVQKMFDDFFKDRGVIMNMLQMMLGNVSVVDKIQPEILRFLKSKGAEDLITNILKNEWAKLLDRKTVEVEELFDKDKLLSTLKGLARRAAGTEKLLNTPVSELLSSYKETMLEKVAPNLVLKLGEWLSDRIEMVMENLHLQEVVRSQVATFSVDRLEDMVLGITSSEMKMITYLGALLGGIIGIFQGIIAVFFT